MNAHSEINPQLGTSEFAAGLLARLAARPDGRVSGSDTMLDFAGLSARAKALGAAFGGSGTGPVAICAAKSPEAIAGILAVIASGRAYAPLDPAHPDARIESILDGLRPGAVLVDDVVRARLAEWSERSGVPLIPLSASGDDAPLPGSGTLAAVLHTSGSTGTPKQVRIGARAIEVFARWVGEEFALDPADRVLSHAPLAFDLSFLDVFAALHAGADIALAEASVAQSGARLAGMIAEGVTFLHAAPSAFSMIAAAADGRIFPDVRAVLFAGEPMPADVLARLFRIFPAARVVNIYGCTETNDTFFHDVPRIGTPDPLPLGRPLPHVEHVIMSEAGLPVAPGEEGELWVRCQTMMEGYGDCDATAAAFGTHCGQRYYRSRDRVRQDADGVLQFLGRVDSVVKIRGNRIDLIEVETHLAAHPGVVEAAVFTIPRDGEQQLEAALSLKTPPPTSLDLRLHAMRVLPAFAIPKRFDLSSDPLPRNSNGKICRRMLAARAQGVCGSPSLVTQQETT